MVAFQLIHTPIWFALQLCQYGELNSKGRNELPQTNTEIHVITVTILRLHIKNNIFLWNRLLNKY